MTTSRRRFVTLCVATARRKETQPFGRYEVRPLEWEYATWNRHGLLWAPHLTKAQDLNPAHWTGQAISS